MTLKIDGNIISIRPLPVAMVQFLIERRPEIERYPSGEIILNYVPGEVSFSLRIKLGIKRIAGP